jgi:hypothetical protein
MRRPVNDLFSGIACATTTAAFLYAQAPIPVPTSPVEPIPAIVEAFRSHPIVALGNVEGGNEQSHAFQLALPAAACNRREAPTVRRSLLRTADRGKR